MNFKKIVTRIARIICGNQGIYGKYGKCNHFSKGVLIYEAAIIGNHNYFAPYTLVNNCIIGNYNSIGPGCMLGLGEHDLEAISTYSSINNGEAKIEPFDLNNPTIIENDVWIGANAVIKQGVHIANGAVVGAGAIITHNVPAYAIVVGIPAKIIKYRFTKEQIKKIINLNWFVLDEDLAKEKIKKFINKKQ